MKPLPCKCGSIDLKPKMMSETGEKWVHCDRCGNMSTPIVSNDRDEIISVWNKEQITSGAA